YSSTSWAQGGGFGGWDITGEQLAGPEDDACRSWLQPARDPKLTRGGKSAQFPCRASRGRTSRCAGHATGSIRSTASKWDAILATHVLQRVHRHLEQVGPGEPAELAALGQMRLH